MLERARRLWRRWSYGRKFSRIGRGVQFIGPHLELKGHAELGNRVELYEQVTLRTNKSGRIVIGDGVVLAEHALLLANDLVEIAAGAYVGPFSVIRDTNHVFVGTDMHWRLTPHITHPIRIGAGAFIGSHVYIGPNVDIGEGAVLAPGSVLMGGHERQRSVGAYEVWAGMPARCIAHRKDARLNTTLAKYLDLVSMFGVETAAAAEPAE